MLMKINCLLLVTLLLVSSDSLTAADAPPKPVKVFILAGQSNMEGQAVSALSASEERQRRLDCP
jgi:hypothetical protein